MSSETALVMRATGSQGRGVIKHISKAGWNIHALVADPSSGRALQLKSLGKNVKLYKGIYTDPASIEAAVSGCSAIFLNQMPSFANDTEIKEAREVLQIAKSAGARHIVHSTNLLLNDPHAEEFLAGSIVAPTVLGKRDVEKLVRESGIPWTIIRGGPFMANLINPLATHMFPELKDGKFVNSYGEGTKLALTVPDTIGAFEAAAYGNPEKFIGKIIPLANEILTIEEIVNEIAKVSGKQVQAIYRTQEETDQRRNSPLVAGQVASSMQWKLVNLDDVKSWGLSLTSFKDFLEIHQGTIVP